MSRRSASAFCRLVSFRDALVEGRLAPTWYSFGNFSKFKIVLRKYARKLILENDNYRMATGGVDDPSYDETAPLLKNDDDANERGRFNLTYASTPGPPSGEEIEMAVKHLERTGAFAPETSYSCML